MSDIVDAFKQTKGNRRKKNLLEQETVSFAPEKQTGNQSNRALEASQQQNIALNTSGTRDSDRLAQLEQLAAAETAQNEANKQATQQEQVSNPKPQLSEQAQKVFNSAKDDTGWKKYYDEEKQKVRDQAFKNDGFGSWLQDVFNAGWDARLAEQQARNRYTSELNSKAFDGNGNILDQNAVDKAQGTAAYNLARSQELNDIERANSRALGATYDSEFKDNQFLGTLNAIRRADIGNAMVGGAEGGLADAVKFLINTGQYAIPVAGWSQGILRGAPAVAEAVSGRGLDKSTGNTKDLDAAERIGRGVSGAIDIVGPKTNASEKLAGGIVNLLSGGAKETGKTTLKEFVKNALGEGLEEGIQEAGEYFGDGGKVTDENGNISGEKLGELAGQAGQAAALGALGGGLMSGANILVGKASNAIRARNNSNINTNVDTNENISENVNNDTNENVDNNLKEDAKAVSKETGVDINPTEMQNNEANIARVVDNIKPLKEGLNTEQEKAFNQRVKELVSNLEQNKISYTEYLQKVEALQNEFSQQVDNNVAQQQEQSATGQQVNPENVSNIVEGAEGTQASEATTKQTTPVESFSEANNEANTTQPGITEGMARLTGEDPIENNAFRLGKKDIKQGVELADGFTQDPLGYEAVAMENNIPIAYDYTTRQPLYFLSDVYAVLDQNGGKDVNGVEVETPKIRAAKEADTSAKQRWESLKRWNDDLKAKRQAGEISQYEYENQLDLPRSREEMQALGKYFDNNYIKSLGITGQYEGDASAVPPIWGNKYRGTALEQNVVQDIDMINDMLAQASEADRGFTTEPTTETTVEPTVVENTTTNEEVDTSTPEFQNFYREQDLARRQQLLQEYAKLGMTPELQQKIQEANMNADGGEADLSGLTKQEIDIYRKVLEFNPETSQDVEGNIRKAYLPQQYDMSTEDYANRSLDDVLNTGRADAGIYQTARTGAVAESGRMGFTNDALVDLHMRSEGNDLQIKAAAADIGNDINPTATTEQIKGFAEDTAKVINELNNNTEDTADSGLTTQDIEKMKPADKMSEAGRKLGVQQTEINQKTKGISLFEKIDSLGQWRGDVRFGDMQNINSLSQGNAADVDNHIMNQYRFLSDRKKQEIISGRKRLEARYLESTGSPEMAIYLANREMLKQAWTNNAFNYAAQVKYTDKGSRKVMNEGMAYYLLKDRHKQSAMQKIASGIQRVMNSSFRGMRWQTTLNEVPEIVTSMADYGTLHTANPFTAQQTKARYGMSNGNTYDQFLNALPRKERIELQTKLENAGSIKEQVGILREVGRKFGNVLEGADTATQWNGFVQDWKDATFLQNAERYYASKGLKGIDLKNQVMYDFYKRMLPMDRVFKYIKSDAAITKPLFMYLDSGVRLSAKFGKGLIGSNDVGVNADMGRARRIARNAAMDVFPRIVSAAAMGVPLASVIGLVNIGGADYSGIDDEDKTITDEVVNFFGQMSPILSLVSYGYNQNRQEEIAKAKGQDTTNLKGDAGKRTFDNILKTFTPLGNRLDQDWGIFGNINSTKDVLERGAAINKQGRVQYLSPDNPVDMVRAIVEGANRTSEAREYNKNPDLLSAIVNQARGDDFNDDGNTDGGFNDFIRYNQAFNEFPLDLGLKDENDYNRPQNQYKYADYNGEIKKALEDQDRALAKEWYEKGRAYNAILDNLRVENPDAVDVYYSSMGKNLVQPEKWKTVLYGQNPNGEPDLTVWNLMKDMAIKQSQDFGTPIDPAYTDLDDEQTRRYLQYKSTATGEDTALKKIMTQDPFWKEFFNAQSEYWKQIPNDFDDAGKTERVQKWNEWNNRYSDYMSFISGNIDSIKNQELALQLSLQFPLMAEYQSLKTALQSKYGDEYTNSQEYKSFWKQNYDAYQAESTAYNEQMLYIINQMRRIEGYDDLTMDEMNAINNIGKDSKSGSGYSRSGNGYSYAPKFENIFQASPVYASVPNPSKMRYNPAGRANFDRVPMSGTMGGQPYAAV